MTIENNSNDSCLKEDDIEKDRRRINLLNDSNYGIVLCFLDKFRSILDLPNYPLQLFEDHLINYQDQNSSRLIDFHFILLKRLSLAKNAQRDKFDSIITKFASRFDLNDGEHLTTTGYLQADINVKIRIIKNLLESQFDLNHTLFDKSSCEIKSLPLGRDRFGGSYWFFMDDNYFVRLFREDVDSDRTWTNIVKNRDELEKFIKLLITDSAVRTRFSDWTVDYEPFSSLLPTNEFEQYYSPIRGNVKEESFETTPADDENSDVPIKKKRGRPKSSTKSIKDDKVAPPTKKKPGRPKGSTKSLHKRVDIEIKEELELTSNEDEKPDVPIKRKRGRPKSSTKLINNKIDVKVQPQTPRGRKRKLALEEDISIDDMSLALRSQKASVMEPISIITSKTTSQFPKKTKVPTDLRSRRRRKPTSRRNLDDHFYLSTSSSDEHIDYPSEDEYNTDDYQSQIDINDNLFEFDQEEDNSITNEPLRTAKTAQTSTIITTCYVCSKSDRPEVLLLCDDCNDAYHLECLYPSLLSVPDGDWFCPLCEHKKLSECLINKFKELILHFNLTETKQRIRSSKKSSQRKIKIKEYNSDESITASESEHENIIHGEESMLSTSQINENSNLSSCYFDDDKKNISQRGRHRRTRFDIKKMLHEEYDTDKTDFNLQFPKKITRLLHRHDRSIIKNDSQTKPLTTRVDTSPDLNEKLGSPLVYVNSDGNSRQVKSVVTNSKQTLKIVRRWNDVQRRSRLKATNMKILNETITSDYADENSGLGMDDTSPPCSNYSNSNHGIKEEDSAIHRSKISITQPITVVSNDRCSSRNIIKKADANFDRLTRDILIAVSEAHLRPITTTKVTDQQHVKRIQKTKFSPYMPKMQRPLSLSKLPNDAYNIFKSKDSSIATSNSSTDDLSNIILTPSSSSSLLDVTEDQTTSITNT